MRILEVYNKEFGFDKNQVAFDGKSVPDGKLYSKSIRRNFIIKGSKILKFLRMDYFETNKGNIIIESQQFMGPFRGNLVYKDGKEAPDGKYRLGLFKKIKVKDGKIV